MKAQTSIEFLTILAAVFVIVLIAITVSQNQLSQITYSHGQLQAQQTVDTLSTASKEVYSQGEGARKRIYLEVPKGYDFSQSVVANRSIAIRVGGSDFFATFDFDVVGQLPTASGPQWIWVISEGNRVRFSTALISLNKQSLTEVMQQNSTVNDSLVIQNIHSEQVTVNMTLSWNNPAITVTVPTSSFVLQVSENNTLLFSFFANVGSAGFYTGTLAIQATSGNSTETVLVPITVQVVIPPNTAPPLYIIPSYWNETVPGGQNVSKVFDVCTNSVTSISDVTFTPTTGASGIWVGNLNALPAMGPNTCLAKIFNLSVPSGTSGGNYTGAISAQGGGVPDATDSIALTIQVPGTGPDTQGPLVTNISHSPKRPFLGDPVTIRAVCDDTTRGNNSIRKAEMQIGTSGVIQMGASDGSFDEPVENVSYSVSGLQFGLQNATVRCNDSLGNLGPSVNYTFKMMVEIMEITKNPSLNGNEEHWDVWLNDHTSGEGFTWNIQRSSRQEINQGDYDLTDFAMVLIAGDATSGGSPGTTLASLVNTFANNGGRVVLADQGAGTSLDEFGLATSTSTVTRSDISIRDNTHYMTSPFSNGTLTIYDDNEQMYYVVAGYTGTTYATANSSIPLTQPILARSGNYIIWGARSPDEFNTNGDTLSTRIIDYAIMNSTIGLN